MNEDYCSYELSKALKAAGFDEPCGCCYIVDKDTESNIECTEYAAKIKWNSAKIGGSKHPYKYVSAPNLAVAQKWLREKRGYIVAIHPEGEFLKAERTYKHTGWNYSIIRIGKNDIMAPGPIGKVPIAKYEQALAKGIAHALELITD